MAKRSPFLGGIFGGRNDRPAALLRAYGKLPAWAEYRRLEVAPGPAATFSRWLDNGREAWLRSNTHSENGRTHASRLLLGVPDSREVIVASVWDSRDSVGRVFPFTFFVMARPEELGSDVLQLWTSALSIFGTFEALHREASRLGPKDDFAQVFGRREIPLQGDDLPAAASRLHAAAATIRAENWMRGALPAALHPADFASGLLRRRRRWSAPGADVRQLALACPLSGDLPYSQQALLWLVWLGPLVSGRGFPLRLLCPADGAGGPAALHVLLRDLLPDDFQLLTSDEPAYGFVERLSIVPPLSVDSGMVDIPQPPSGPLLVWLHQHALAGAAS